MSQKIAFLQPHIPHYREEFFTEINKHFKTDIYCYDLEKSKNQNFEAAKLQVNSIKKIQLGPILLYSPFRLLKGDYKTLVLMLHFGHITTWFLLLSKFIHRKKIILWGQGISVKRYLNEEKDPSIFLQSMIRFADSVWLYTEKEMNQWKKLLPNKDILSLNNTISGVERILELNLPTEKAELKLKYNINSEFCFIFSARFNNPYRRTDLLIEIIKKSDPKKFGFIIIGDGNLKPNLSEFLNVYDFGAVYETEVKDDLFMVADLYLQPGWVGLSIVEAMAYGKPVITFKRSEEILQCVEYHYLLDEYNAILVDSVESFFSKISDLKLLELDTMGKNGKSYVKNNLLMSNMVSHALKSLN